METLSVTPGQKTAKGKKNEVKCKAPKAIKPLTK